MEKGTFDISDAGLRMGVNVRLTKRDKKTGRIIEERQGHNMALKSELYRNC